jgi:hypothetical protein
VTFDLDARFKSHLATARHLTVGAGMNTAALLNDQKRYFAGAYDQFCAFGGPCVHFHRECIRAGEVDFLSDRHIEMLYATLTAWGMQRMGDADRTKTKLANWDQFRDSLRAQRPGLEPFKNASLLDISDAEYEKSLAELEPFYRSLKLSVSGATVVVNSKALFHVLPSLIPPIDRQYTIRFFTHPPDKWRYSNGKFKTIMMPSGLDAQVELFRSTCLKMKWLADRVDRTLLDRELLENTVTAPKAIDNAIVDFVRLNSGGQLPTI